jgi:tetratricopeptide (TPR) repeat protein
MKPMRPRISQLPRAARAFSVVLFTLALPACGSREVQRDPLPGERKGLERGLERYLAGRYGEAEREFTRYLILQPDSVLRGEALCWRGLARLKLGRLDAARTDCEQALETETTDTIRAMARKGVADALFAAESYRQSRVAYEAALDQHPEEIETHRILLRIAMCDLKMGRWARAEGTLRQLRLHHTNTESGIRAKEIMDEQVRYFTVQCGAFSTRVAADSLYRRIVTRGFPARVESGATMGKTYYRVRVGRFQSADEAEYLARRLRGIGFPTRVVP